MPTRLYYRFDKAYFPQTLFAWDQSTLFSTFVRGLDTSKAPTALAHSSVAYGTPANPSDNLWAVFASRPLAAQTVSGTLKGQARVSETNTAANLASQLRAYLVDGTTGAIKSTLYGGYAGALASEWATSLTNRRLPLGGPVALTSQTAVAGDRILVMVGSRVYNTVAYQMRMELGTIAEGDLPENETATSGDAWLEFSADLTFSTDFDVIDYIETMDLADGVTDAGANRIGDPRSFWGEQTVEGTVTVPTELQIWPRGNRQ